MKEGNKKEALNLYAKVEDMLGVKEYAPRLYEYYFSIIDKLEFNSLLDIGCGSGDFLESVKNRYNVSVVEGIDRSDYMIEIASKKGLNVSTLELKSIEKEYDIATATFDMVNYLTPNEFIEFFKNLKRVVKSGGYFVFDVNTEFGLGELAVGNFISDDKNRFLAIESFYENGVYDSNFTYFEKFNENCYKKELESIRQYYYPREFFELLDGWEIVKQLPIKLYEADEFDKILYLFKNSIS